MRAFCLPFGRSVGNSWALVIFHIFLLLMSSTVAMANPLGGSVVAGNASIAQSGNLLTVQQNSARAIINWQDFSIQQGEVTRFVQPSVNAAILNRVSGSNPSALLGTLEANGRVFLINPNGILIGSGANINVGSFTASTLDINNAQFMQGGELHFSGDSTARVINHGTIKAVEGDIYLIGAQVENHGVLQASHGTVGLAAGQSVRLVDSAHQHLVVETESTSFSEAAVQNTGTIDAVRAGLAANGGNVFGLAINNSGTIRANGAVELDGEIYLTAPGGKIANSGDLIAKGGNVLLDSGEGGTTTVSGQVDVAGDEAGSVKVLGQEVELASATIDASGDHGGGKVLIGGDYQGRGDVPTSQNVSVDETTMIRADAIKEGNGGKVIVWSDGKTTFAGLITGRGGAKGGNGGFAEVSGLGQLRYSGLTNLSAPSGKFGTLLLDPATVTIGDFGGTSTASMVDAGVLSDDLELSNVAIITAGVASGDGNLVVERDVVWTADTLLSLLSRGHVLIEANILACEGDVIIVAGWNETSDIPPALFSGTPGTFGIGGDVILDTGVAGRETRVHSLFGDINVYTRDLRLDAFAAGPAALGSVAGNTMVDATRDVIVRSNGSHAQLGFDALFGPTLLEELGKEDGALVTAPIEVDAGGDVKVLVVGVDEGEEEGYSAAQIGSGGPMAPAFVYSGDIKIDADGEVLLNVEEGYEYGLAMIGNGGSGAGVEEIIEGISEGVFLGEIDVTSYGSTTLEPAANHSTTQIGHGGPHSQLMSEEGLAELADALLEEFGIELDLSPSNIEVRSMTGEVFVNPTGEMSTGQIGHGGYEASGFGNGSITVVAENETSGVGNVRVVVLGNGSTGQIGSGTHAGEGGEECDVPEFHAKGDITIDAGAIFRLRVRARDGIAQAGHGGYGAAGSGTGVIMTESGERTGLLALRPRAVSFVGHGNPGGVSCDAHFDSVGNIFMNAGLALRLIAESTDTTAQAGHQSYASYGTATGNITASAFTNVLLNSENSNYGTAHIGSGGSDAMGGPFSGNIIVVAGNDLRMLRTEGSYATIGNGDLGTVSLVDAFGDVTAAWDQQDPMADGGGRLYMSSGAAFVAGGEDEAGQVGKLKLFGTVRGDITNIENSARFNGVSYLSSGTPGTINGTWTPNTEFSNWNHEQWGFYFGGPDAPYTNPFVVHYLGTGDDGVTVPTGLANQFTRGTTYDRFMRWWRDFLFASGASSGDAAYDPDEGEEGLAGTSSNNLFESVE